MGVIIRLLASVGTVLTGQSIHNEYWKWLASPCGMGHQPVPGGLLDTGDYQPSWPVNHGLIHWKGWMPLGHCGPLLRLKIYDLPLIEGPSSFWVEWCPPHSFWRYAPNLTCSLLPQNLSILPPCAVTPQNGFEVVHGFSHQNEKVYSIPNHHQLAKPHLHQEFDIILSSWLPIIQGL